MPNGLMAVLTLATLVLRHLNRVSLNIARGWFTVARISVLRLCPVLKCKLPSPSGKSMMPSLTG